METILAPTDFSSGSVNAVTYAANLSRLFSAKLILFHAYHTPVTSLEGGYIPPLIDMKIESEEQMQKLEKEIKNSFPDVEIDVCLKMGLAADVIEEVAKEKNIDLIVMGITGQNNIVKEHLIGSVASKVAVESTIPVLIVPEKVKYTKIKNLAYACDLDKDLEQNSVLIKVKYFSTIFSAELKILNVMKPNEEISEVKALIDSYVEERLKTTNHNSFFIYDEKVDKGLLEYLDHDNVDIIVTCPKKHNFFHNIFVESNTKKLVFNSPIPILTIHS